MNQKCCMNQKTSWTLRFLYETILGRILLKIIILPVWSLISGYLMNSKISTILIKPFIKKHNIDMSKYKKHNYNSFNEFFTRELKTEYLNIDSNPKSLISPCDAKLSAYKIEHNNSFKIKGITYDLKRLTGELDLSSYEGGYALIFRLSVDDYHRYLFPCEGNIIKTNDIKGTLHTVQPIAFDRYPVFMTNHRVVSILKTKLFDEIIAIEVGALMVGKINNYNTKKTFKKGAYKGEFRFGGSSIILLIKPGQIRLNKEFLTNTTYNYETIIKVGEPLN